MAAKNFNPYDNAREPREKGWEAETEEIIEHIRNRGDQRIGQLLINAVRNQIEYAEKPEKEKDIEEMTDEEAREHIEKLQRHAERKKAKIEKKLWSMEADKLLKLLDQFQDIEDE